MSEKNGKKKHTYNQGDNAGVWFHDDGTPCPEYWASVPSASDGQKWWCTDHQQYVTASKNHCVICKKKIQIQIMKGTGVCSENCRKARDGDTPTNVAYVSAR